jgi:hypothetical protein
LIEIQIEKGYHEVVFLAATRPPFWGAVGVAALTAQILQIKMAPSQRGH